MTATNLIFLIAGLAIGLVIYRLFVSRWLRP